MLLYQHDAALKFRCKKLQFRTPLFTNCFSKSFAENTDRCFQMLVTSNLLMDRLHIVPITRLSRAQNLLHKYFYFMRHPNKFDYVSSPATES